MCRGVVGGAVRTLGEWTELLHSEIPDPVGGSLGCYTENGEQLRKINILMKQASACFSIPTPTLPFSPYTPKTLSTQAQNPRQKTDPFSL